MFHLMPNHNTYMSTCEIQLGWIELSDPDPLARLMDILSIEDDMHFTNGNGRGDLCATGAQDPESFAMKRVKI